MPLISADKLTLAFESGKAVLDRVSLTVQEGEIVTIIGPNGAGKTTLLRVLLGFLPTAQGQVMRHPDLRMGYMPQKLHIDATLPLTVQRFLSVWRYSSLENIQKVLSEVGAAHVIKNQIHRLSGGEFQRVMLARALLNNPQLLVLDEPAQGVDVHGQIAFFELIDAIRKERGCGVLMVSHDLHLVMARTDTVICLNHHVCCFGQPHAVSRHPEYMRLFGRHAEALAIYHHSHDHAHDPHGDILPLATKDTPPDCCDHGGHSHG